MIKLFNVYPLPGTHINGDKNCRDRRFVGSHYRSVGRFLLLSCLLVLATTSRGAASSAADKDSRSTCPEVRMEVEKLPDLQTPRAGHSTFSTSCGIMTVGGHTTGFVPTPTAECYNGGRWSLLQMTYTHDDALTIPLSSGKVLVAGGHEQHLGIGQTFVLGLFDPVTKTFSDYGCLDRKRTLTQGLEMDNGRVVIAGNWYADDGIELFDGSSQNQPVKDVAQQRSSPYILRTAKDNAIIFGAKDCRGVPFDTIVIDRLKGEPFVEPLLQEWRPFYHQHTNRWADSFIGDEAKGQYAYLIRGGKADGQMAIIKVEGERFSLLPTACPIPTKSQWEPITYFSNILADRQTGRAYMLGCGKGLHPSRYYILCIDYNTVPAPLTLYYSDPQDSISLSTPILTAEGNLLMAGGTRADGNNFSPLRSVRLFHLKPGASASALSPSAKSRWQWALYALLLIAGATAAYTLFRRNKRKEAVNTSDTDSSRSKDELMNSIREEIETQKLFLKNGLSVSDVASKLGTNSYRVSECIKSCENCNFSTFINRYRIEYAKEMMRNNPEKKISMIYLEAGFGTEKTFFKVFKDFTGKTPKEWMEERSN